MLKNKKYIYKPRRVLFPKLSTGKFKKFTFSLLTCLKEQGLSQNKLIKIKSNINNNDRANLQVKTEKKTIR